MIHGWNLQRPQLDRGSLKTMIIYFVCHSSLMALSYLLFLAANLLALHRDLPNLSGHNSILDLQPGLSIRPRPDSLTSLIRYKAGVRSTMGAYIHDLLSFVHGYERHTQFSRLSDCTSVQSYQDHPKYSCKYPVDFDHGHCNIRQQYGFDLASPCVAVKLNRVIGWVPSFSRDTNQSRDHGFPTVKIKCDGVTEEDRAQITQVCYYDEETAKHLSREPKSTQPGGCSPHYGQIRNYYFPYKKQNSYQIPFVWAKFIGVKRHVVVMIRCWAIADNIKVDFNNGLGSVTFEILID